MPPPPLPFSRGAQFAVGLPWSLGGRRYRVGGLRPAFAASGQDPTPWKPAPSLVMRGPYRFTRNPMYVGMFLRAARHRLHQRQPLHRAFGAASLLLVVHYTAVLPEEAYLEHKFGDDYRARKRRVRRYL